MFLKKLYDRCVELARHKFSKPLLGFVAFIESFFFPVPPDLMIVPMVVAKREDYLKILFSKDGFFFKGSKIFTVLRSIGLDIYFFHVTL